MMLVLSDIWDELFTVRGFARKIIDSLERNIEEWEEQKLFCNYVKHRSGLMIRISNIFTVNLFHCGLGVFNIREKWEIYWIARSQIIERARRRIERKLKSAD